jgi:hypothetical protein
MCRIGDAHADVYARDKDTGDEGADASYVIPGQSGPRLAAYAYAMTKDVAYAKKAIAMMLAQGATIANAHMVSGPDSLKPVEEDPRMSTNEAAQSGLSTIEVLEFCKDQLPTEAAVRTVREFRGRPAAPVPAAPPATVAPKP